MKASKPKLGMRILMTRGLIGPVDDIPQKTLENHGSPILSPVEVERLLLETRELVGSNGWVFGESSSIDGGCQNPAAPRCRRPTAELAPDQFQAALEDASKQVKCHGIVFSRGRDAKGNRSD